MSFSRTLACSMQGELAQQFVAGRVAAGVVDDLELVEVEIEQRMLMVLGNRIARSVR